jgi:hypothetical protein
MDAEDFTVELKESKVSTVDSYHVGPVFSWLAPLGKTWEQTMIWTRCRDIMGCYLQGAVIGTVMEHGGVAWREGRPTPDLEHLTMLVRLGAADTKDGDTFNDEGLRAIIWTMEDALGLERTRLFPLDHEYRGKQQIWVLRADPFWMKAPPLLSLYLLLVRTAPYLKDYGSLKSNVMQTIPDKSMGGTILARQVEPIDWLLKQGVEAWEAPQEQYYDKGCNCPTSFYNRGINWLKGLTLHRRVTYLKHAKVHTGP